MVQGDINQITSEYLILSPKISNLTFASVETLFIII